MKLINEDNVELIEKKEDEFYLIFLDEAIGFANGTTKKSGLELRQLVTMAAVQAKNRQTRSARMALAYQQKRDAAKGLLAETENQKLLPETTESGTQQKQA